MRSLLWSLAALSVLCVLFFPLAPALSDDDPPVTLELTYPAGKSPKVFTKGWVFGARCVVAKGTPEEKDLSSQVRWGGTGKFAPAKGAISRPSFEIDGRPRIGPNEITLLVVVAGKPVSKTWTVQAVDPTRPPYYAKLGDIAKCPACAHGCMTCPHSVEGEIISGSPTVTIGGLPAARVGDKGIHRACCGPNIYKIMTGDPSVLIDGKRAARRGDETLHCGFSKGKIIGPPGGYYAVFVNSMPELKESVQAKFENKKDMEPEELKALLSNLTWKDFDFPDPKPDADPMILRIEGAALAEYPKLKPGAKYALALDGKMKHEEKLIPISGAILLVLRATYSTLDELENTEKKIKPDQLEKIGVLSQADGTGTGEEDGQKFTFGPLTEGWTPDAKKQAAEMILSLMPIFDCFIADAVYADREAKEVNDFRRFRERVLRASPEGRHLIRLYEEYGPSYAMQVRRDPLMKPLARFCLDRLARWVAGLDLENPETVKGLLPLVKLADAVASRHFKEGESTGVGRLIRVLVLFGMR